MSKRHQIYIWIIGLAVLGLGTAWYKYSELGFPLLPGKKQVVWTVEAKLTFDATGDPVTAAVNLPDSTGRLAVVKADPFAPGYGFSVQKLGNEDWGVWTRREASGKQSLYFQVHVYELETAQFELPESPPPDAVVKPVFEGPRAAAAEAIAAEARARSSDNLSLAVELLQMLENSNDPRVRLLRGDSSAASVSNRLLLDLLAMDGVAARTIRGLRLDRSGKKRGLSQLVEVFQEEQWVIIDPSTREIGLPDRFLIWQRADPAMAEVRGGRESNVDISVITNERLAQNVAVFMGKAREAALVDFSIYSLPVETQNTFKLLLLIPIGALVVVILRNLVGIKTSGTFMPILITLVFLQTTLVVGLVLFVLIVGVGLSIRAYLSRLNLLLVPRISAVLVVVIIIFVFISVISLKLGIESGLNVTFFPMIIISWTIERLSILWEEEGPRDVFVQGGGSLLTAVICYSVMSNRYVEHLAFNFPELLLVVLSIILLIGNYTGYRLSELRRFEPLAGD